MITVMLPVPEQTVLLMPEYTVATVEPYTKIVMHTDEWETLIDIEADRAVRIRAAEKCIDAILQIPNARLMYARQHAITMDMVVGTREWADMCELGMGATCPSDIVAEIVVVVKLACSELIGKDGGGES